MVRPRIGGADLLGYSLRGRGLSAGARNALGQFTSLQTEIQDAHKNMALVLQRHVKNAFRHSLEPRVQKRTRYLEKALASPDAIEWNVDGFLFLPEGYLDRSQAKFYWRHIEKGTRIFVGREMRGFFRSLEGDISPPMSGRRGSDPYMPQTAATFGSRPGNMTSTIRVGSSTYGSLQARVGDRLIEQRTSFELDENEGTDSAPYIKEVNLLNRRQVVNGGKGRGFPIIIKRPIKPHRFLETGIERFVASGFIEREYDRQLRKFQMYRKGTSAKGNVVAVRR